MMRTRNQNCSVYTEIWIIELDKILLDLLISMSGGFIEDRGWVGINAYIKCRYI